jgi:predicted amidohydrolase YtcJ
MRVDGHAMWVNSAALHAAGIEPSEHSGLLVDEEMQPVWKAMPVPSQDELRQQVLSATSEWVRHGVTEIHDMDVAPEWLDVFRELAESGHLPVRIQSFVRGQHREWAREGLLPAGGELHRLAGVKLFADGALGSRGAFLRTPYSDDPSNYGIELLSVPELIDRMTEIVDAGWPCIAVHAIGDAAVRNVLDAYSAIRALPGGSDMILRIEHSQHVAPEDVQRFAELKVLACVQSSHCLSDASMAEKRLGAERLSWSYRWRTLLSAGVTVTGGSDAPIESPSVVEGLRAFVDRVPIGHSAAWCGAERITAAEALDAYTSIAHCASGMEYRRGRIEVGYDADLVVVSHDIAADEHSIPNDVIVRATFTAGRLRYAG